MSLNIYENPKRIPPYDYMKSNEKSWVILRAYRLNILDSKEMKLWAYLKALRMITHYSFPFLSYLFISTTLRKNPKLIRFYNPTNAVNLSVGLSLASWGVWWKVNPFRALHRA